MVRGKKAEVEGQKLTMGLLLLVIIILILVFFSLRVFDWMTSKGDVESCRLSVVASGKISDVTMGVSTLDLECPRKNIVLSAESYTVDESEKKYASDEEEDYSDNVKQVFAEEMRECWYKMGEGEVDLFDENWAFGMDSVCVVCSQLHFENPPEANVGNLYEYLQETKIPLSIQTQQPITYYDYLHRELKGVIHNQYEILEYLGIGVPISTTIWVYVSNALNVEPIITANDYTILFISFIPPDTEFWKDPQHAIAVFNNEDEITSKTCDYLYS